MDANKGWDLEAGNTTDDTGCGTPKTQTSGTQTPIGDGNTEKVINIHAYHPIIHQRQHFLAAIAESLSVGLGLGSAVGIWACINETLKTINVHMANWVAGVVMGFILAPLLEKGARLLIGKMTPVLKKPRYTNYTRLLDDILTIMSALWALGLAKGIQRQYGPLHTSLGFEFGVFVVGFCAHSFLRTLLYTIVLNHDYEGESMVCGWAEMPAVLFWEYLDHFHHVYVLVTVNLRDFLTFALYPYLAVVWMGYWETVDSRGEFAWVGHGLNIGFFFVFFTIIKEVTYLVATPVWSPDLPLHCHHSI
ncbi:hypothetical protein B0T25DRAFT_541173 [Lasiosphaeria hispida]|uniref:Uncharacterized protein n=1 Tax=Lasiosphaeria hispida TaxID=260671 RepID=A0AAJ0HNM4_9PEZI|nr:hypothetical protein B0T25DRAFT_541173 [Lasiosphaeria hispida]